MYSGESLYRSKTLFHSKSDIGGRKPSKGRHSTIDRPESVNLVMPPIMTIKNTIKDDINSQLAIYF